MAKHKKKKHSVKKAEVKKKFNIKEYLPIIAIIAAAALLVGGILLFDSLTTKETTPIVYTDATVYFLDDANQFAAENVKVDSSNIYKGVVEALVKGPANTNLKKAVAGDVKVLSAKTKDGLCTVDLSKEFGTANSNDVTKEAYAVYAIVNSLCMFPEIRDVKINIDGDTKYNLGHVKLDNTFEADWNMVRYEDRPQ